MSADAAPSHAPGRPERVAPRRLAELIAAVDGLTASGDQPSDVFVTGITHDSASVRGGDLFAALPGQRHHGVEFVSRAADSGAVAVLTDPQALGRARQSGLPVVCAADPRRVLGPLAREVYGDPSAALLVIGVTGTNGKTTSSYLIESGLRAAGHRTGLIGTVETRVAETVLSSLHTTPEAPDVQALLAVMRERNVSGVAMEVSSHALALHRIDGTTFRVAVFTNLSQDHLDFHRDLEEYFAAKSRLFTPEFTDVAVVDVDDPYGARLAASGEVRIVAVSPRGDASADWYVTDVEARSDGSSFVLRGPGDVVAAAQTGLPGAFNVANAALSIVALAEAGVPLSQAVTGVGRCDHVPGRLQRVEAGQAFVALVDYAHTPDAVATLLATLRPVTDGRLIIVLGCGGDRDRSKRPLMGAAVAAGSDIAIFTSDNPRSEDPLAILEQMQAGVAYVGADDRADVRVDPDRRSAIRTAVSLAAPGDVVVVAGKGHEQVQEIAGQRLPFDDADELAAAVRATVPAS